MRRPSPLAAALFLALAGTNLPGAWAQAGGSPPPASPQVQGQAPPWATPPDQPAAAAPGTGAPLGEELERSEGVIAPADPGVDPGLVKPAPDTGAATMPVIPPPGTPGGDPNLRPR